jgi:hypothetical protein
MEVQTMIFTDVGGYGKTGRQKICRESTRMNESKIKVIRVDSRNSRLIFDLRLSAQTCPGLPWVCG